MRFILASASERRKQLLKRIITNFDIMVSDFCEEDIKFKNSCSSYVMEIAKGKALNVANKVSKNAIIIACDTVVYYNGNILGKPKDEREAFSMLKLLSGNVHQVYSGVTIINTTNKEIKSDYVCTNVKFSNLSDEQIQKYVNKGESLDKAGAYGIQGLGSIFVKQIEGCYYNVVGLPLNKLYYMLKRMGVNL